jgi:hypothetical protein
MSSARVRVWEHLRQRRHCTIEELLFDVNYEVDRQQIEEYMRDWIEMRLVHVDRVGRYVIYDAAYTIGISLSILQDRIEFQNKNMYRACQSYNRALLYLCYEHAETYLERHVHKDVLCIIMSYIRE